MDIQIIISPWHINDYKHVWRPPLQSYLTADMEATRKGKACTAVVETAMQSIVNWIKKTMCGPEQGIMTYKYNGDTAK